MTRLFLIDFRKGKRFFFPTKEPYRLGTYQTVYSIGATDSVLVGTLARTWA